MIFKCQVIFFTVYSAFGFALKKGIPYNNKKELLKEIKSRLKNVHGKRLKGVVLFGSEVRVDSTPDSDIDLLVLLDQINDHGRDLMNNLGACRTYQSISTGE